MGLLIGNVNGGNYGRAIFGRSSSYGNAKLGSLVGNSARRCQRSLGSVEIRRCGATATAATTTATRATAERLNNTGRSPRIRVQ